MKISVANKTDRIIALSISILILLPCLNFYLNNILALLIGSSSISVYLYFIVIVLSIYGCYYSIKERLCNNIMKIVAILLIALTVFSYLLYSSSIGYILITPDFHPIYSQAIYLWLFCIPALILGNSCRNWDLVIKFMSYISPFVVLSAFIAFFLTGFRTYGEDTINYMTLSYNTLTAGCVCFYFSFSKLSVLHLPFALLSLFVIAAAGCRGALVCILFFIIIQLFHLFRNRTKSKSIRFLKIVIILLVCFGILSTSLNFDFLSKWFEQLGIDSRSLRMLTNSSFFEDNARDNIRNSIWKGIVLNPFGYGLFGDRYITSKYYSGGVEYAHNIMIEIWAQFGLFFGSILLLTFFIKLLKVYFFNTKTKDKVLEIIILLLPFGFIRLMFSGSYLNDIEFFIMIGILYKYKRKLPKNEKYSDCCDSLQ